MAEQKTPDERKKDQRDRKRAQRERDSAILEELRESEKDDATESAAAESAARRYEAYVRANPLRKCDLESLAAYRRNFDQIKAEAERKSSQQSKRTLFALTHGMPVGWASLYPNEFPPELR